MKLSFLLNKFSHIEIDNMGYGKLFFVSTVIPSLEPEGFQLSGYAG